MTRRYEVEPDVFGGSTFDVVDTDDPNKHAPSFMATKTEAVIIAWALNAIADDRLLCSTFPHDQTLWYDGPTDGVLRKVAP